MSRRSIAAAQSDRYLEGLAGWLLIVIAASAVAVRFASPILDSDLFWQMAYARQMIEHGTLVLDHTTFSWTPSSNATVYCAWIAELTLHGLWNAFGPPGMFALCYAAALLIVWLMWRHARGMGMKLSPMLVMVVLIVVLASAGVIHAKPELFSVVFTHMVLWACFRAKWADRQGDHRAVRYLALLPATMLVWVNTHGGFILLAPVLAAVLAGELINRQASPGIAMSSRCLRWLLAACVLCALATLATPYGVEYPVQLFMDYVWNAGSRPDVAWNNAYRSPFAEGRGQVEAVIALLLMFGTLIALCVRAWRRRASWRKRVDFVPVLLVLGTLPLYLLYLRSTYVFVAVFGYVAIWLASPAQALVTDRDPKSDAPSAHATEKVYGHRTRRRAHSHPYAQGLCALLVFALAAHTLLDRTTRPPDRHDWLGFGISTLNPVEEAEFLERSHFRGPLYNTFETGGYLLWKLNDGVKVMVDARSFPYLSWFDDQYRFVSGEDFDGFLRKYPGPDVALIDYAKGPLLRNFARSPEWGVVFIGPSAAVFVRKGSDAATRLQPERSVAVATLRNAAGAIDLFDFARFAGDYRSAWSIVDQFESTLGAQGRSAELHSLTAAAIDYRRAHQAAGRGQYAQAFDLLNFALEGKVISEQEMTTLALMRGLSRRQTMVQPEVAARLEEGLLPLLGPLD
ncbi:MAG: hypothetical protein Q7T97_13540 [Burkholderiaceae bacterium]|nr:hypothetical protein [Burkholderiaceae bacterium]